MTSPSTGVVADLDLLLADLRELVEVESPSSDPTAVAASAEAVARVGERLLGSEPERILVDGVVHLRWRLGPGPTRVLVLGHHDTVWPLGTLTVHPFGVVDGVVRGPGCFDMKAGLVMAFHAVAALPGRDGVTILVTGDEEIGSPTSRALIESEATGTIAALVLEASADDGALKTARKGTSLYEVEVVGRAAHAGLDPEKGVNATLELAHQVHAVAALADATSGTTVTPTVTTAGTTANTVPATGRFAVDVRAWSQAELERVDAALRALSPALPGASVVVHGGINRPPLEESSSRHLFRRASALAERWGLPPVSAAAVGGASDGNFTAGVGVATLDGLGAVGGGAHAADEHVLVDRLVDRTVLLGALLADLLTEVPDDD
ncbi:M20/M25/M40 family metallo-hydrolase [Nocardioides cavernae]|uniref:M20/M25/M40 family metallo-hydrolase n=1 Tax=Nocardioides cavernae TaxID=1921566 RepID=A0ABR8NI43_9ACTN|nr:M20/M25/M40 family metallo-hydrolase [Nocardioides cavernae]MBD3927262.1 M20/M25/M40 family metallo-hydrolase [Nocardioides cavernae]MBM7513135.1 glutamate carboxypeptidase [Nocardioides cavernae]